jgi:hypothetical protein
VRSPETRRCSIRSSRSVTHWRGATAKEGLLAVALAAAERALRDYRDRASKLGRARMYGERSIGHDDPGMLAIVLLLRAALATPGESGVART